MKLLNRRDLNFVLDEVLGLERILTSPRYAHIDREGVDQMIDTAEGIAEEFFEPLAAIQDANEPKFVAGAVQDLPEVAAAVKAYADAGFLAAGFDADVSGLQLPFTVRQACDGFIQSANPSLSGYPLLTIGAADLIRAFGSDEQIARFLPPMLEGRWLGTMCLSEPQAGSSLSDIRTKAEPIGEGRYKISGTKMWISNGDNAFSENIIHLVLAKIPGGPPGVKGISLFIVPKIRIGDNGALGGANDVSLAGLNHKMGQRGLPNALLNFGEAGDCEGFLVGEEHRGLGYMFQMMNAARIGVGQIAAMLGYAGYLYSLDYARNRPQGRPVDAKDPTSPQVPIAEHADIKRLLLLQKVYAEGAFAFILYCSTLIDEIAIAETDDQRRRAHLLLEILTPIAKSWPSEFCLEANKHALQVLGGYGYTREYPIERMYRDNRINPIHEGAHGIHGLDILGRKVRMEGGGALSALLEEIRNTATSCIHASLLRDFAEALVAAADRVEKVTKVLVGENDIRKGLANATNYLDALGHVVIAWVWLRQASSAMAGLDNASGADRPFYEGKLAACQFFYRVELPKALSVFDYLETLDDTALAMPIEAFTGA